MPLEQASRDTAAFAVGAAKAVVCADGPSRQGQAPAAGVLVQRAAGEKVAFVERGSGVDRQIAATERPHGTLEFTSAPGPARGRSRPWPCRHLADRRDRGPLTTSR